MTLRCLITLLFFSCLSPALHAQNEGTLIGDIAPNIIDVNHKNVQVELYQLRGSIVLVDFWASWCRPCRMANPTLLRVYKKYKDKKFKNASGFHVFSVSLDRLKETWLRSIKLDQLFWDYHVCTQKYWYCPHAEKYKVKFIPASYLIDGNGLIIATFHNIDELEKHLQKLLIK
jgi:thiol-disulfide isomerase/thioredoxin